MNKIFIYSHDNFKFMADSLPESNQLTYYFFTEINQLKIAIKQLEPKAVLFDTIMFNDVNLTWIDTIGSEVLVVTSENLSGLFKNKENIYVLPEQLNKANVSELFLKLRLIKKDFNSQVGVQKNKKNLEKVTKEKEQSNQQLLNLLMDNLPDAIYFKDRESRYTKINKPEAALLQVNHPEEAVGKTDEDFFGPALSQKTFMEEQALMESGIPLINKFQLINTFEGEKYIRSTKAPLMNADGECIGLVGITRDVTSEYLIEKEFLAEKKLMDLMMNNVPERIYFKDRESRFIRSNLSLAKQFGLKSPEELYGKTDFDFHDPIHAKEAFEDEQAIMKNVTPILNKQESYLKNGERFWVLTSKIPLVDDQDEVIGLVGISRNYTKQKELELSLKKEKELLQMLIDNVPDYIYFKDKDLKYIRVNKSISEYYNADVNDIIGKTDLDFFPKKTAEKFHKQGKEVLENDIKIIDKVQKLKKSEGKSVWISTTKVPIKDEFSNIIGLVGVSRDVTLIESTKRDYELARAKAEEANKAKSLFLANMSHEIRTPMNGIIGMADILSKSNLDPTQNEYLDVITKSGQTLLSLINNILDFSKIESGKMELEIVPINIRSVIEEVADIHIVHASRKAIDVLTYIDPEVPEFVGGDYIRLKQIITNLVNNAIKFTSKGEVVVHVNYIGKIDGVHEIQFKVKDSGIGITEENQKKLFKSFSQVDASTTRKYGGTGLGLAISHKLVTLMGGELDIESSSDSGSTFFFKAKFNESGASKNSGAFISKKQLVGKHVAIIDDNETNRIIFKNYLETWQVKVSEFKDGFEALSYFKNEYDSNNPIDLVLVDFHMPGMDGKELAHKIKADQKISDLKLILLSSITDALSTEEMSNIGFETGLNKPIKMNQLLNIMLKVLGVPHEQKEFESQEIENHLISYKNKKFLIVEDNLINIKVAQIVLGGLSKHIEVAKNGQEAVDLFLKNEFDVILMDVRMPVMDGMEATLKIRELENDANIEEPVKIIATTANTYQEDVENCMDIGMDAFLEKPFKRKDLLDILQQLM
ncbi:PAS domain-containing protein [Thalassobellus citreus]|uniref:PAS domain-containing protein n=1 Tax=Thalassobellus citreus TaxID=3367752 RepID=UPI0037A9C058